MLSSITTAQDRWQEMKSKANAIVTLCPTLDTTVWQSPENLGHTSGFPLRQVTELCGAAGTGKSQLCMQLSLNVQIHTRVGGVGGQALYIDTEGSLAFARLQQMADELDLHIARVIYRDISDRSKPRSKHAKQHAEVMASVNPTALMQGVRVKRCLDYYMLLKTVESLPAYLSHNPSIRLIVLDSMAYHLRYRADETRGMSPGEQQQAVFKRAREIEQMGLLLHRCAYDYNVAVVVTNHVTAAPHQSPYSSSIPNHVLGRHGEYGREVIPALSDAWAAIPSLRVVLMHAALLSSGSRGGLPPQISATLNTDPGSSADDGSTQGTASGGGPVDPMRAVLAGAPAWTLQAPGARVAWVIKTVRQSALGDVASFSITSGGIRALKALAADAHKRSAGAVKANEGTV